MTIHIKYMQAQDSLGELAGKADEKAFVQAVERAIRARWPHATATVGVDLGGSVHVHGSDNDGAMERYVEELAAEVFERGEFWPQREAT